MDVINIGVLTISDRCARGEAIDQSGPQLVQMVSAGVVKSGKVVKIGLVPDSKQDIVMTLKRWCDKDELHLILTTGGTGLSERDVTPEATSEVVEKIVPGISFLMFKRSSAVTPLAALSRAVAGIRGRSLIINLPGSKRASMECLEALAQVIPHAVDVITDRKEKIEGVHVELIKSKKSVVAGDAAARKRQSPYPCISVRDAQEIVLRRIDFLQRVKTVRYDQAHGHVLEESIFAHDHHPPFDTSLVDGYAVKTSDATLRRRTLVGVCVPGEEPSDICVLPGTCVRVSTGGPIPKDADAVIKVEDTQLESLNEENEGNAILFNESLHSKMMNIRKRGSNFEIGETLMKAGTYVNAAAAGLLATAGIPFVRVFSKPVVAVMSTGNELCNPGEALKPGKVRDCNRIMLISLLKNEKYETVDLGIVEDEADSYRDSLEKGFRAADVVVTTGSMSMGERDLLKEVIEHDFEGDICFGRVLVKPGKPTGFGVLKFEGQPKVWFGLPGNPTSAAVCSELFLLPGLRKISGFNKVLPQEITVSCDIRLPAKEERPQYLRASLDLKNRTVLALAKNQCSSCIKSCVDANCLLILPPKDGQNRVGYSSGTTCVSLTALVLGKHFI